MAVHAQTNYTLTTKPAKTSLLGGHFIYRVDTTQGTLTPSSANIIQNVADNPQQWGYNTHIGANGIKLRYNETTLSEWKADRLTFYKPGTNNPSLELINGINTALNIYNPANNTKVLGLDTSGLNFYGTSISVPDVILNADGLTLINGSIRGGIVGQDEFLYLSPQVFADEYEEYVLSEDTEVDETKVYYIRSGEEGAYTYTEVSEPTGNPQENEYYEIAHAPGTIPIDNYVKDNWRQIIGRKFAVDTDGNLYANGLNANNANIEGNITATSLRIGSGSDTYDGVAAINISGYDIEIEKNSTDVEPEISVYLYPHLYHNGIEVDSSEINYSRFIWYEDDNTSGVIGDSNNYGRTLALYGHTYRVTYTFDDGAVGGGTEVQTIEVDPSKYITKISDTGITIHPEMWTNQSSYIQLDGSGLNLFDITGTSIAQYGNTIRIGKTTENHLEIDNNGVSILNNTNSLANFGSIARIGLNNSSRFLMNANSLEAYDSSNNKYFEVSSSGLSWGNNTAATVADLANKANASDVADAAKTATNYITNIGLDGISIHANNNNNNLTVKNILINADGVSIRNGLLPLMTLDNDSLDFNIINTNENVSVNIASFGLNTRIGQEEVNYAKILLSPEEFTFLSSEATPVFNTGVASEEIGLSKVNISPDWNSLITTGLRFGKYYLNPQESTSVQGTFYSSTAANLPSNTRFSLWIKITFVGTNYNDWVFGTTTDFPNDGFKKSESKTIVDDTVSVYYDGVGTFTVSGTYENRSTHTSYTLASNGGIFYGETDPIETNIYNTFIGGNTFINSSNGGLYLELPQKDSFRYSDYALNNIIEAIGWGNEVMVGIKFKDSAVTIYNSGTLIDNTLGVDVVPLTGIVTVESSDTSLIEGGDFTVYDGSMHFIGLDIVSGATGTCTITASMTIGDKLYSDSCVVTLQR